MIKEFSQLTPVEQVLYKQFIRYEQLQNLVTHELSTRYPDATEINVFIDLYEMLLPLYNNAKVRYAAEEISSAVINHAAHYRAFFRTRYRVETKIVFVYSSIENNHIYKYIPEYNKKHRGKILNEDIGMHEEVQLALQRLDLIVPYIPDVFIKYGTVEPAAIIRNIILSNPAFQADPNIVITRSQYAYQLPCYCPDTVVFKKKYEENKGLTAFSFNEVSAISAYIYEVKNKQTQTLLNPKLITAIMALSGIQKRNIKSIFGIEKTLKVLSAMPQSIIGDIDAMYTYIHDTCTEMKLVSISYEDFYNRYMGISIEYQTELHRNLPEGKDVQYMAQLSDPDSLKMVNNKYYRMHPLDLERL